MLARLGRNGSENVLSSAKGLVMCQYCDIINNIKVFLSVLFRNYINQLNKAVQWCHKNDVIHRGL